MAKKPKLPTMPVKVNVPPGATTTSTVKNVSNSGQMSTSTHSTGATGAAINTGTYTTTQGAPGTPGTPSVTNIVGAPASNIQVGETPGAWNWMDDAITNALKNWPRG